MHVVTIQRPVTFPKLAESLGLKPFKLMALLIKRSLFPSSHTVLDDVLAVDLAADFGVVLNIIDGDDGGASSPSVSPVDPPPPLLVSREIQIGG